MTAAVLSAFGLCAGAQTTAPLARANRLEDELHRRPLAERQPSDYTAIIDTLAQIWTNDPQDPEAAAARFNAAELYMALARDLHVESGYESAAEQLRLLLKEHPYSGYRRNTEWALAQLDLFHVNDRAAARQLLRDFLERYPADPRTRIAKSELQDDLASAADAERKAFESPITPAPSATNDVQSHEQKAAEVSVKETDATGRAVTEPVGNNAVTVGDVTATTTEAPKPAEVVTPTPVSPEPTTPPATPKPAVADQPSSQQNAEQGTAIRDIRLWSATRSTSIVLDLDREVRFERGFIPESKRLYFDIADAHLSQELRRRTLTISDAQVRSVRLGEYRPGVVRVVVDEVRGIRELDTAVVLPNPPRLVISIKQANGDWKLSASAAEQEAVRAADAAHSLEHIAATAQTQAAQAKPDVTVTVMTGSAPVATGSEPVISRGASERMAAKPAPHMTADSSVSPERRDNPTAQVTSSIKGGDRAAAPKPVTLNGSLTRALGLKIGRIVIDAGHGGHDTGTIGPDNLYEKDVVLDVALRLGRLLRERLGAEVIYTRHDDTFIPLQERTAIANQAHADLFISVHGNSNPNPALRGIETYYLSLTSNRRALAVAARENADSGRSVHDLQTLVQRIALNDKLNESRTLARYVETSLDAGLRVDDHGIKRAPFVVLIGAQMPSILSEISFLSNPQDARLLRQPEYREKIARALYRGISHYVRSLGGLSSDAMADVGGGRPATPRLHRVSNRELARTEE